MTQPNIDLFGESHLVIDDNKLLTRTCNEIMELVERRPDLLDGKSIGEIDRKLMIAVWAENGLREIFASGDKMKFQEWLLDPDKCISPDIISRARRFLVQHDKIRLSKALILEAETKRKYVEKHLKF